MTGAITKTATSDHKRIPQRCSPTDPHACDFCGEFLAIPGLPNCPLHNINGDLEVQRNDLYALKKTAVAARLALMKGHPESRSLANELGILRITLEETINKCDDAYDLVMNEAAISRLVTAIQSALVANQKLEEKVGELLSVDDVITLVQMFFEIIKDYVTSAEDQEAIANRISEILQNKEYVHDEP